MVEEKLSQKITVLFSKTMDKKLNEICRKNDRPKSNLIRWVVQNWVEKALGEGVSGKYVIGEVRNQFVLPLSICFSSFISVI